MLYLTTFVFVKVKLNSFDKIVLEACYIPPISPCYIHSNHVKSIEFILSKFNNNIKFLVIGYYNWFNVHMILTVMVCNSMTNT